MSKRFTDTEKYADSWFRKLSPKHKCLWLYVCDSCDNIGVWKTDWEKASFDIGAKMSINDLKPLNNGKNRIVPLNGDKYFIIDFANFQYGSDIRTKEFTSKSFFQLKIQQQILEFDKKNITINNTLSTPCRHPYDNDMVCNGRGIVKGEEEKEVIIIYAAYPKKKAPVPAKKAIAKALSVIPFEELLKKTTDYAAWCKATQKDMQFIPYPATWFNQGQYNDEIEQPKPKVYKPAL